MASARKKRTYEKTCNCSAYAYPHRMFGGRCKAINVVYETFAANQGFSNECSECMAAKNFMCEVLHGGEPSLQCVALQNLAAEHEISLPLSVRSKAYKFMPIYA